MKRLEIPGGGMPFTGDDLMWMSDGIYEAVLMLANKYAEVYDESGRGVVSGLNASVTGGVITLTPGWVVLEGVLCYCTGWSGTGALHNYELYYDPVYDPLGNDVFADSVSRDTYKIQRASVRPATIPVDNDPAILRLSIIEQIRVNIRHNVSRTIFVSTNTKIYLEKYDKVCVLTLSLAHDTPSGNLCVVNSTELPYFKSLNRQTHMFSSSGIWKGVVTFDDITGVVSFAGTLPGVGELPLFGCITWLA